MIHGFNIEATGTAFTAVSTDVVNRTNKEMAEEEIFSSGVSNSSNDLQTQKVEETSNISYETQHKLSNSSLVVFNDPTNGKYAIVSLQNSTIDMLKNHFGEEDFYKRDDGITRLDNKAEAYVAGWFGDIAYKREFLSADSNKDGLLSDSEHGNTKTSFLIEGGISNDNKSLYENIVSSYGESRKANLSKIGKSSKSIDDELDKTLSINKDMNSEISLKEAYNADSSGSYEEVIYRHAKQNIPQALKDAMMEEKLKKLEEHNDDKIRAMVKLLLEKGDISMLDTTDKELLSNELSEAKEDGSDIQKIMNDKLDELLKIEKYKEYE